MNEQKLLKLKKQIQEDKETLQRFEGQEISILEQLQDQFKCSTIEQAEKLQKEIDEKLDILKQEIKEKEEKLEQYEV